MVEAQGEAALVREEVARGELDVPRAAGVRVPFNGTRANDQRMKLSTQAYYGPVPPTSITRSPSIGSMLATPKLSFSDVKADGTARMSLTLRPNMDIFGAGTITLNLPGFRGQYSDCLEPDDTSVISVATWNSPRLVLTLARAIVSNCSY